MPSEPFCATGSKDCSANRCARQSGTQKSAKVSSRSTVWPYSGGTHRPSQDSSGSRRSNRQSRIFSTEFLNLPSGTKDPITTKGPSSLRTVLIALIKVYKAVLSPVFAGSCRFYPSCSQYAIEALEKYGAIRGSWMALKRIARCNPFHPGGFDPVP